MKKKLIPLFLFFIPFVLPYVQAQDVAIVGWDAFSGDEFSFVLLRDFIAGEIIYFTEDEYSDATNDFDFSSEAHIAYEVPAGGLLENDVIRITESGANTFTVGCAGGTATKVTGSGNWSLAVDAIGGMADEIYAYSASNAASPWNSVTEIHCFVWSAPVNVYTNAIVVDQVPSFDYPNCIEITFNIGGAGGVNADLIDATRINTTLADLQNGANWTTSANTNITLSCTDFTTQMIVLPVELAAFDGKISGENIALSWTTLSEVNNDYFEVQRSKDGIDFETIGTVDGKGTTSTISQYLFRDEKPVNGHNYYRLLQMDFDGHFSPSDIISVEYKYDKLDILTFPNPFDQSVSIDFRFGNSHANLSHQEIKIYDVVGSLVYDKPVLLNNLTVTLDLSMLSSGTYYLITIDELGGMITQKLVKF
ncbi:MAG: T9SS type A sorting domain-containing protein [Bacteroidota bacterium]